MIRRIATLMVVVVGLAAIACIDMSAPKGAASISSLLLPSPSVVVGDTMRDSLGKTAPLRVIAYDANDAPIANTSAQFFITDSAAVGHLNNAVLVGDKLGSIHIVGQVGNVQTNPATVPITVAPTKFALSGKIDTLKVPAFTLTDTTTRSVGSATIAVTLHGVGDTASVGFVVKYELQKAPATISSSIPGIFFSDDGIKVSSADTSDATGASRRLYVRSWLLVDQALRAGSKVDSAVVVVTASYKGAPVSGSPIRVVIPIKGTVP